MPHESTRTSRRRMQAASPGRRRSSSTVVATTAPMTWRVSLPPCQPRAREHSSGFMQRKLKHRKRDVRAIGLILGGRIGRQSHELRAVLPPTLSERLVTGLRGGRQDFLVLHVLARERGRLLGEREPLKRTGAALG